MLRASEGLSADDVAIRCRVRHSPFATNREFSEPEEMICTMRIWNDDHPPSAHSALTNGLKKSVGLKKSRSYGSAFGNDNRSSLGSAEHGPELLLRSTTKPMSSLVHSNSGELGKSRHLSKRFTSFGSNGGDRVRRRDNVTPTKRGKRDDSSSPNRSEKDGAKRDLNIQTTQGAIATCEEYRIPISDIMVVDMYGVGDSHRTNITTLSHGYFEFTLENRNGQEILLAFLKASLPRERIMDGHVPRSHSGFSQRTNSTASRSFDVEAFTASRMAERMRQESFSEKLRRRVGRVVSSIEEISSAISECACGCSKDDPQSPDRCQEKRDSPPRHVPPRYNYDVVEIAPESPVRTNAKNVQRHPALKSRELYQRCHLPSGLSVECEPEMKSTGY